MMNKIFKVIWSKVRNCYVAVSEIAKRNGKDRTSVTGGAAGSRQAGRVLCGLLLGAYLTAGYSMPVAWGTPAGDG
ncbi:MAG: ESPR domain-containing protein, partial [Acidaminococcaceae bacterium]|nr:ESPR domain-containing protein [Acidaminococcaceae bacterium]